MTLWRFAGIILLWGLPFVVVGQPIAIDKMHIGKPGSSGCVPAHTDTVQWPIIALRDLPQGQRFCLIATVEIPPQQLTDVPVVIISLLGSSRVYWDGNLIAENGIVGDSGEEEMPGRIYFVAPIPVQFSNAGQHQLAIDVSNFHITGKMRSAFYYLAVGDYEPAVTIPLRQSGWAVFMMGGLLVIGLLFQLLFWLYQRRLLYQVFSLLCLSSVLLLLAEKWRSLFGYSYDLHAVRLHWIMVFTYISCLTLPAFYLIYYRAGKLVIWLSAFAVSLLPPLFMPGYDSKSAALFFCSLLLTLAINLTAWFCGASGAWLNTLLIAVVLGGFALSPFAFLEDRFALTSFAIVLVVLASLIREMKDNRIQALATARYEMELLKRNLQPHFLMNSLTLAIEWIEQKPGVAAHFVQALADELRMLVKFSGERTISLAEEVMLCRRHLEIMEYRYNASYRMEIIGALEGISVPPMVLHTQIENGFSHNRISDGSVFRLTVKREKANVVLLFSSPLQQQRKSSGAGLGERYIRTRLNEVYGRHCSYESREDNNVWLSTIGFRVAG